MPDWSIKIIPNRSGIAGQPALLVPDLVGAKPGDPLQVQEDDLVSWNNETGQPYQPWPTDDHYNPLPVSSVPWPPPPPPPPPQQPPPNLSLSDLIPGNLSSTPAYNVLMPKTGNVIYYCLKDANGNATKVCGQIIVSAIPKALNVPKIGS